MTHHSRAAWAAGVAASVVFLSQACVPDRFVYEPDEKLNDGGAPPEGGANPGAGGEKDDDGSGGSLPTVGPPEIATKSLKDAGFNAPYNEEVRASGGDGTTLAFMLSNGRLPRGLALDSDGILQGIPTEDGEFSFTVTVTDEKDRTDSRKFSLTVLRKRWLAYVGDPMNTGVDLLYAVNVASALLPVTLVSAGMQPDASVGALDYVWSADGSTLAFLADGELDDQKDAYVVDFSGAKPGAPVKVNGEGPVTAIGLSPDGSRVGFIVETYADTSYEARYVDLADGSSSESAVIGPSSQSPMYWMSNERVVYGATGGAETRLIDGTTARAPQALNYGWVERINRESQRILFMSANTTCSYQGWLYDFEAGGTEHLAPSVVNFNRPTYNQQLTHVIHGDGSTGAFVFEATDTRGEPLGLVSPADRCQVVWSPGGTQLVLRDGANWLHTRIEGGRLHTTVVPGTYGMTSSSPILFSNDARLIFADSNRLFESVLDPITGEPGEAVPLTDVLPEGDEISTLSAAPNGDWVVYTTKLETMAIDLRSDSFANSRKMTGYKLVGNFWDDTVQDRPTNKAKWSGDSSRIAFSTGSNLYAGDMLHDTAAAKSLASGIETFMFQP
jgi:Putative Ig domain